MGFAPPGVRVPEIRINRDGEWFVDGERIVHERTCQVLTENVRLLDDGRFVTSIGRETAPIVVDDTAFFVLNLDGRLSDGTQEALRALKMGPDGRLYARVKNDRAWARFSRAAHHAVEPLVEERDGRVGVRLDGQWLGVAMSSADGSTE